MSENAPVIKMFDALLKDETEKAIMKLIIDEKESAEIIEKMLAKRGGDSK